MNDQSSQPEIGYLLRSYPRLSQTFILREIVALEELGLRIRLFAVTDPQERVVQVEVGQVKAPVHYLDRAPRRSLPAVLFEHLVTFSRSPRGYVQALGYLVRRGEIDKGYTAASRFRCFLQAVYLAQLLATEAKRGGRAIRHLHAHFAHDPTLIALLTHILTGIPYSFTAHARDLYQIPGQALVERMESATTVVTCSAANLDYLRRVVPERLLRKVRLVYHGVDLRTFHPPPASSVGTPSEPAHPQAPLILSAGRLVEKKGFHDLLHACGLLKDAGHRFRCQIYGDGPLRHDLLAAAERLGLSGEVALPGEVTQHELVPLLQRADIFALTPFVTGDGDRDGVPNVLVEAMACGVPVVSTAVAGVPELVEHGCNGLLAMPRDVKGIADALALLLADAPQRKRLGEAGRRTVVERFDLQAGAGLLAALLGHTQEVSYAG